MGPVDATIVGNALNSFGFTAFNTVEGLGLNTFGFLWPCDGIWNVSDPVVSTTWVECESDSSTIETCMS